MKTYELTYIISSEITSEEAGAMAKEVNSFIESKEGTILRSENPVAKTLSYPIKKFGSGYFVVLEFSAEPEKIKELGEKLKNDKKILRHLVIIKRPARTRKERKSVRKLIFSNEAETKNGTADKNLRAEAAEEKGKKIELEEIEKKLDEILGE
ncbi:MAG: 30S ribosomal protein S6 [Candidatus Staskawiczbacteria bacterium RIFCSPLOWO2_12_FULL_37_15]|uniref:Small ribosomal subunit protein bS6 n=1 Tax=Candidatus Staskawiczbacteria bacterium RIFCSPLOWO2_12_FULL_37_15 TaxID=1802218 RepID=A0A1G2IPV9_9BACT|nr:MAG: 30S ribosomal protein S6 [Parcubacteria group bacterium GW2011_GWA2_37_10]OGZ76836.1 MAG: 30S ribosomal protein S6 [Candidatus Staskawiczbacteria bacterium RIFCSPLOWO2_12_FULL_37_15]